MKKGSLDDQANKANFLHDWGKVIRRLGEKHDAEEREWRVANPPQREVAITNEDGETVTFGVWLADEHFGGQGPGCYYGPKFKNGYHRHTLMFIPVAIIGAMMNRLAEDGVKP